MRFSKALGDLTHPNEYCHSKRSQGYNSSTSNAAIAQNIFGIALSQFVSYRMKCSYSHSSVFLGLLLCCPCVLSSNFIQPNSTLLLPFYQIKQVNFSWPWEKPLWVEAYKGLGGWREEVRESYKLRAAWMSLLKSGKLLNRALLADHHKCDPQRV